MRKLWLPRALQGLQGAWKPKSKIRSASSITCQVHCATVKECGYHALTSLLVVKGEATFAFDVRPFAQCTYVSKDHIYILHITYIISGVVGCWISFNTHACPYIYIYVYVCIYVLYIYMIYIYVYYIYICIDLFNLFNFFSLFILLHQQLSQTLQASCASINSEEASKPGDSSKCCSSLLSDTLENGMSIIKKVGKKMS